jgi:preprotein translocase subunit SecA
VVLSVLDRKWREHLYEMDYLREGIGLRAMAQRDPLVEYQREGYDMFSSMMEGIKEEAVGNLFNLQFEVQENPIVEEVGAGAQLAFGGTLPGVTTGAPPQDTPPAAVAPGRPAPAIPPAPPEPAAPPAAFGKKPGGAPREGGRARGRHAADGRSHATAAGRGEAATKTAPQAAQAAAAEAVTDEASGPQPVMPASLEPRRARNLQYSAPAEDGGVERHGETEVDLYANVGRNDPCPCGSGRKYKRCHGDPRNA